MATTSHNIFLLNVNFDKSTVQIHFLRILSMFAKFSKDQKSIYNYVIIQMLKSQVFVVQNDA